MIKLLVVDDSALVRKLLVQVFTAEPDFEVEVARDGTEALEMLHRCAPDVMTLDVHMPGMDGLACLDRIMVERPCPVVMVSSLTAEGAEATLEALRLGAVDFVPKPTGAVSLRIGEVAGDLVEKVRVAAGARLPSALRLRDRVRHRIGARTVPHAGRAAARPATRSGVGERLVLVGVSTGGPPALERLLGGLDASFPWPILVAQHMPRSFTGPLARRLNGLCALEVDELTGPVPLEPGHVYIGRGEADMIVSRRAGVLVGMPAPSQPAYPWHPSTDRLVRSALDVVPADRLTGVLLTGMGDDGAAAMKLLFDAGGHTVAEAEETAVVWGMPGELVRLGGAEFIEPLPQVAARLHRIAS